MKQFIKRGVSPSKFRQGVIHLAEWFIIASAILIICAFVAGVIVGVKIGMDISYYKGDDDFHV